MAASQRIIINPIKPLPATRDFLSYHDVMPQYLPSAQATKVHPENAGGENASLFFVGTATVILEWAGVRIMTDPNFLHAGDHVHLGPGITATRMTNPAVDLHDLPRIDCVLLSHYHGDHFDQKVEQSLRRDLPIITTPHAKKHLFDFKEKGEEFTEVVGLKFFSECILDVFNPELKEKHCIKVMAMPGSHVPEEPPASAQKLAKEMPPTNGWMVELGYERGSEEPFECAYRIYISGDTMMVNELKQIPERYKGKNIDLMLVHLGGTTIPSPENPLLMVTMDGKQGVDLIHLIQPDITIPIHYDDYDLFLSPLGDFKKAVDQAGLTNKVVYLDRKDQYRFKVK